MKFEFIDFYPGKPTNKNTKKTSIGTVHIYAVDCKLDIRGIIVFLTKKGIFFQFPHFGAMNRDDLPVKYPFIHWRDDKTHKEMMSFLHTEVRQIVCKRVDFSKRNRQKILRTLVGSG